MKPGSCCKLSKLRLLIDSSNENYRRLNPNFKWDACGSLFKRLGRAAGRK